MSSQKKRKTKHTRSRRGPDGPWPDPSTDVGDAAASADDPLEDEADPPVPPARSRTAGEQPVRTPRVAVREPPLEADRVARWTSSVVRTARKVADRAMRFFEPRRTLPIAMDPSARLATPTPTTDTDSGPDTARMLRGHAAALSVPDVLGVLSGVRKSGVLNIWTDDESYRIWLVDGTVVWAQSHLPKRWLLIGQILVAQDAIAQTLLAQFLEQRPESHARLGEALVEAGLIDRKQLERAIAYQAQRIFDRAYAMLDASYSFQPLKRPGSDARGISVTYLLLESARSADEAEHRRAAG